jgi:hypothetical protein
MTTTIDPVEADLRAYEQREWVQTARTESAQVFAVGIAADAVADLYGRRDQFIEDLLLHPESVGLFVRDLLDDVRSGVSAEATIRRRVMDWAIGQALEEGSDQ